MRSFLVFLLLLAVKVLARLFYRFDIGFIGTPPADAWRHLRLAALLNHTSLWEPLFASACPAHFLWRLARHGLVPIARKTTGRPLVGHFYRLIAHRVVAVSRERDETWQQVMAEVDPDAMVVLLPEGRMKRATGLDLEGKPMTVRGGIADLLAAIGSGRMLLAYSGGLHHVHAPGERLPRLWKTLRLRFEVLEIADYRAALLARVEPGGSFKREVIADLERRRDLYCPTRPESDPGGASSTPSKDI